MELRKATIHDIGELVEIRMEFLIEGFADVTKEQSDTIREELLRYYNDHLGRDFEAYIAKEQGKIISSVFLVTIEKPANPSFFTGKIGNVLNVFTRPEYRNQGLASRLMKMMMEEAKEKHLSYLDLMATEAGYPLYKKLGFEETEPGDSVPMKLKII